MRRHSFGFRPRKDGRKVGTLTHKTKLNAGHKVFEPCNSTHNDVQSIPPLDCSMRQKPKYSCSAILILKLGNKTLQLSDSTRREYALVWHVENNGDFVDAAAASAKVLAHFLR